MKECVTGRRKNVIPFQTKESRNPKPTVPENAEAGANELSPRKSVQKLFAVPPGLTAKQLASIAQTIPLADIGVTIPKECPYPERFEAGFRHGLESNALNKIDYFKRSFRWGFCWAKAYYQRFFPDHPLTARLSGGKAQFKNTSIPAE